MQIPTQEEILRQEKGLPPIDTLELPKIKPLTVKWQSEGFAFRTLFIRLPESVTLQHLNDEPKIWRAVQGDVNFALMKYDRIIAVAFDESWLAEAIVNIAERDSVILAGIRKISTPQRSVPLYSDETYEVIWAGSGYGVRRISDQVMMLPETFHQPTPEK